MTKSTYIYVKAFVKRIFKLFFPRYYQWVCYNNKLSKVAVLVHVIQQETKADRRLVLIVGQVWCFTNELVRTAVFTSLEYK